jgi:hypothetical protein
MMKFINVTKMYQFILTVIGFVMVYWYHSADCQTIKKESYASLYEKTVLSENAYEHCNFKNALKLQESVMYSLRINDAKNKNNNEISIIDSRSLKLLSQQANIRSVYRELVQNGNIEKAQVLAQNNRQTLSLMFILHYYLYYAQVLQANGRLKEAEQIYNDIYNITGDSCDTLSSLNYINSYKGRVCVQLGLFKEADRCFHQSINSSNIFRKIRSSTNQIITNDLNKAFILMDYRSDMINYVGLSMLSYYNGDFRSTIDNLDSLGKNYDKIIRRSSTTYGNIMLIKGYAFLSQNDLKYAEYCFKKALRAYQDRNHGSLNHPNCYNVMDGLAEIARLKNDENKYEDIIMKVMEGRSKMFSENHRDIAISLLSFVNLEIMKGNISQAISYLSRASKIFKTILPANHPEFSTLFEYESIIERLKNNKSKSLTMKSLASKIRDQTEFKVHHILYIIPDVQEWYANDTNINIK